MGGECRQDVLGRAVFVDVAGNPQGGQRADLVGAGDGAAEEQDGDAPVVDRADGLDDGDARGARQLQVEHDEIDVGAVAAHAGEQVGCAADGDGPMSGILDGRAEPVADERRVVGDDDRFRGDRGRGHS